MASLILTVAYLCGVTPEVINKYLPLNNPFRTKRTSLELSFEGSEVSSNVSVARHFVAFLCTHVSQVKVF